MYKIHKTPHLIKHFHRSAWKTDMMQLLRRICGWYGEESEIEYGEIKEVVLNLNFFIN